MTDPRAALEQIRDLYLDNRTRPASFAVRAGEIAVAALAAPSTPESSGRCAYQCSFTRDEHEDGDMGHRFRAAPSTEPALDAPRFRLAVAKVEEEDERVGVIGRGSFVDRVIAEYARLAESQP